MNFHSSPALTDCVVIRGGSCHACHPASLVYFWNTFVHVSGSCLFVVRLTLPVLVQPALNSVHGFFFLHSVVCFLIENRLFMSSVYCVPLPVRLGVNRLGSSGCQFMSARSI